MESKERYYKCEKCKYKWSESYCIKKKHGFLNKVCFRRLFVGVKDLLNKI